MLSSTREEPTLGAKATSTGDQFAPEIKEWASPEQSGHFSSSGLERGEAPKEVGDSRDLLRSGDVPTSGVDVVVVIDFVLARLKLALGVGATTASYQFASEVREWASPEQFALFLDSGLERGEGLKELGLVLSDCGSVGLMVENGDIHLGGQSD